MSAVRLALVLFGASVLALDGGFVLAQTTQSASGRLRVAAWNLKHLTPEEQARMAQQSKPAKRVWRHTFGAERRTETWRLRSADSVDADVIAIQGGTNLTEVRRMFPARTFHLIVSRAALSELQRGSDRARDRDAGGFTSIAVRRRQGLRLIGQRHFLAPALDRNPRRQAIPGVAIRLRAGRQPVWIASFDLSTQCTGPAKQPPRPECDQERLMMSTIEDWIARTRAAGVSILIAGRIAHLPGVDHGDKGGDKGGGKGSDSSSDTVNTCTHDKPRIALLPGAGGPAPRLKFQSSPKKRPCAVLTDLDLGS